MKNFVMGIVFTLVVLAVGGRGYLLLGLAEVRGDLPPSRFESAIMNRAVHVSVRREAPEMANPFPPTDENLVAGGKIYLSECAGCHGTLGEPEEYPGVLFSRYHICCPLREPLTPKPKFSGSQSMAFAVLACLPMECGIPMRSSGKPRRS